MHIYPIVFNCHLLVNDRLEPSHQHIVLVIFVTNCNYSRLLQNTVKIKFSFKHIVTLGNSFHEKWKSFNKKLKYDSTLRRRDY